MRRLLTIIGIILVILLLGIGSVIIFYLQQPAEERPGWFRRFFPFGEAPALVETPNPQTFFPNNAPYQPTGNSGFIPEETMPLLRKLTTTPQAGGIAFTNKDGVTAFRFVERSSGNVWETTERTYDVTQITNTTIPKIYEALWGSEDSVVLITTNESNIDRIRAFIAQISEEPADNQVSQRELVGSFISPASSELAVSPDGETIAFIDEGVQERSLSTTTFTNPTASTAILPTPITEWLIEWTAPAISLITKPSSQVGGSVYSLNTAGALRQLISDTDGITALAHPENNSSFIFNNESVSRLALYYTESADTVLNLQIDTLPEKCTWSKLETSTLYCAVPKVISDNEYPDDWYKGKVSFNDLIVKVTPPLPGFAVLVDPEKITGEMIDAIQLSLSPEEDYLIFTNKKDYSLWSYRLTPLEN